MGDKQPKHERQWRDYQTQSGARPVKDFLFRLPDEDRATIFAEMEHIRKHGKSAARHLYKDIYEVRTIYNTNIYRILFACEGRFNHVLLSLEGFQKKTQQTPRASIRLAEQRLADWRRRGKTRRTEKKN